MRRLQLVIWVLFLVTAVLPAQNKQRNILPRRDTPGEYAEKVSNLFSQHRWAKGKELLDQGLEYYPEEAGLHYLAPAGLGYEVLGAYGKIFAHRSLNR